MVTDWARVLSVLHAGICYGGPALCFDRDKSLPGYNGMVDRFLTEGYHLRMRNRRREHLRRVGLL
jgi:hypothetical protein